MMETVADQFDNLAAVYGTTGSPKFRYKKLQENFPIFDSHRHNEDARKATANFLKLEADTFPS